VNERPWKRIAGLTLWLCLMPPLGLWKLWNDPVLSAGAKWRILIYLCVVPALAYAAVGLWTASHMLNNFLP
jgi:RsiW-degrading membrane proteinase PrsW (M82 family)